MMDITFLVPDEDDVAALSKLDIDRDWKQLKKGQRWIVQTYLRLKNRNNSVHLSNSIPKNGIVVFHKRHELILKNELRSKKFNRLILVSVRSDKSWSHLADFEIVQNEKWADNKKTFFIPLWTQPGLIPRDKKRGDLVKVVSFKGFDVNLHPYFFSEEWKNWLLNNGMIWKHDSMKFYKSEVDGVKVDWHDYKNVDVILAHRKDPNRIDQKMGFTSKPATKLYNAWTAGVPAILSSEYSFRKLRKSELDYIEIDNPEQAKQALLKLKNSPELYRNMVENGIRRAEEFTVEKIAGHWENLFFNELPQQINTNKFKISRIIPPYWRMKYRSFIGAFNLNPDR